MSAVARSLFAVASQGATGMFFVDAPGGTGRLELERGWVHALSNVGDRRSRGEDTLGRLLDRLGDDTPCRFEPRPPGSPLLGFHVTPFHPARAIRAFFERSPGPPLPGDLGASRLILVRAPHGSCLDAEEQRVVSLLAVPRRLDDLLRVAPRPHLERLVRFLAAVGALTVEDPALRAAYAALGVRQGAPAEEVKSAWRRLARDLHPDRHPTASDDDRRLLEARFRLVSEAYRRILPNG